MSGGMINMTENTEGHDSLAVANYFIDNFKNNGREELTCLKLIKLVYIAHGFKLALIGKPLVNEYALAWRYGPVFQSIYHVFKFFSVIKKENKAKEFDNTNKGLRECRSDFSEDEKKIMDVVLKDYGSLPAWDLSGRTHIEGSPWFLTIKESNGIQGKSIDNEIIKKYYLQFLEDKTDQ